MLSGSSRSLSWGLFVEAVPRSEGSRLCCSSLKASRGGMFPEIGVGIGVKACPGCCPSALLLSCSLSWVYALGRAGKPRQEWDGTIRGGLFQQGAEPSFAGGFAISQLSWAEINVPTLVKLFCSHCFKELDVTPPETFKCLSRLWGP